MKENAKIRPTLFEMNIGEVKDFPIDKLKSVRTQCSELGVIHNRQYVTRTDREKRVIVVKRES